MIHLFPWFFPVQWRHEAGQTQTSCLPDDPTWGNDVRPSWRRMERLSKQTCECLCLTLVPLLKTHSSYNCWGFNKIIFTLHQTESWISRAESRTGSGRGGRRGRWSVLHQSTWMSPRSAEHQQWHLSSRFGLCAKLMAFKFSL